MKTITTPLALCAVLVSSGANAALESRLGGQAVYDTDLGITWLADANLATTISFGVSGIGSDGRMPFSAAQNWISAMNSDNYLGYHDWRLPFTLQPDASCYDEGSPMFYNCTGSELGHLYYNEFHNNPAMFGWGVYGLVDDLADPHDESLFVNLIPDYYWSSTGHTVDGQNSSWGLHFRLGGQQWISGSDRVLAVRTGDVATVPVPAAAWLLGSGLLGLLGVARRKTA